MTQNRTIPGAETAGQSALSATPPMQFVSGRALAIGCMLIPPLSMWLAQAELIWYTGHSTAISLFFHVTFVIFLIALLNLFIEKHWPHRALSPGEILTIYVMLSVAGSICSHDMMQILVPMLGFVKYAANPQNRWEELILPHVPAWAIVTDRDACNGLAMGNAWFYQMPIVMAWLKPILFWSFFLMALMMALLYLNVFFRQCWTEKEKLSFPIIQIPLLIACNLRDLLRNKLFWIAFVLAGGIDMVNFISHQYPNVPQIPIIKVMLFRDYFVERPWNALAHMEINLYPFVIGLAFFLPTDLAFSCWFFYLFFKLELVIAAALGIRDLPDFPFPNEQAAGGYLAIGVLAIWLARRHLVGVARSILGRPGGADESGEPMSYRTAFIGLLICTAILVGCGMSLGGSFHVMLVFFLIFLLYSLAIARMRAELGPPAHDLHFMGPEALMANAAGNKALGEGNQVAFSLFFWFNRAYRAHFSAHSIEAFKIAQITRLASRSMTKAVILALVVGLASSWWALLHSLYAHGYSGKEAGDAFACQGWNRLNDWLAFPKPPRIAATIAAGFGFVFTLLLGMLRTRFTWWVWHPVGFATCTSWSMDRLWFCVFLAWVAKAIITRYGGATAYRRAVPFFVGLVMGEFVVGSIWGIWGAVTSTKVYHFWG